MEGVNTNSVGTLLVCTARNVTRFTDLGERVLVQRIFELGVRF
jgi:hypothetical protein